MNLTEYCVKKTNKQTNVNAVRELVPIRKNCSIPVENKRHNSGEEPGYIRTFRLVHWSVNTDIAKKAFFISRKLTSTIAKALVTGCIQQENSWG